MKKIVHVVEAFAGGIFTYLQDLTSEMADDMDIYIVYNKREVTPENFENLFDGRIHFIRINDMDNTLNPKHILTARNELKKIIKEISPDVVHLHSSIAGFLGRSISYNKKIKVFYTPHGYSFLLGNSGLKREVYKIAEKILGLKNVITIACSKSEYEKGRLVTKNITRIDNFVNIEKLDTFKTGECNYDDSFFTIGRIDNQKNPELFNKIASQMMDKNFYWFGDGPMRKSLTATNIKVMGWLDHDDMLEKIKPYKNFILTSKYEGLPISLLEAMYLGKLCFVTDVPGNRDVIRNGINGYLINNSEIYLSNDNSTEILKNSKKDITENYNVRKQVEMYLHEYGVFTG